MKKSQLITLLFILFLGLGLRLYNLEGRTVYEWDQERDTKVLEKIVNTKRPVLSGPVAKGEGGFMLGPLYYYLTLPIYLISGRSILSQAITSIILDALTILAIFFTTRQLYNSKTALLASIFWAISSAAISAALIPWNVSLLPLYSTLAIFTADKLKKSGELRFLYLSFFWWGFSIHVHPTTALLMPVFLIISRRFLPKTTLKQKLLCFFFLFLPYSPLFVFDLRHQFINLKLIFSFQAKSNSYSQDLLSLNIFSKLARFLSRSLTGAENILLGLVLPAIVLLRNKASSSWLNKSFFPLTLSTILGLYLLSDSQFGPYYFSLLFIPLVLLTAKALFSLKPIFTALALLALILLNTKEYDFKDSQYSPKRKKQVVEEIVSWEKTIDLRLLLPVGRRSGFDYYLEKYNLNLDSNSTNVAYVTEVGQQELSSPKKARSIVIEKRIGGFKFTGFSD